MEQEIFLLNDTLKTQIEQKLEDIENRFRKTQGLILTEEDLRCVIYNSLMQIPMLSREYPTLNPDVYSIPVHCQVSWYDENHRLSIMPDISIINPHQLSIIPNRPFQLTLPSKQYAFDGPAILMELKFAKNSSGVGQTIYNGVNADIDKFKRLCRRLQNMGHNDSMFCYFVVFSKVNIKCPDFQHLLDQNANEPNFKIVYKSSNISRY